MLNADQKEQARDAAVEAYYDGISHFVDEAGAVLSETEGGWVKADFIIGTETIPTLRFPKANLADKRWVSSTLRNLDAALTKAQLKAVIVDAVRDLPLAPREA